MPYIVSTERLGWPPPVTGWRRIVPWETSDRLVYDDRPEEPSATCHLQAASEQPARCGFPWECLVAIPGMSSWTDLHPEMRCDKCSRSAGIPEEDPAGRSYRFSWD